MLRRYNFISLTIVLLWILSPFGSQMTLRLLELKDSTEVDHGNFKYFNTTTYGGVEDIGSSFESGSGLASDKASLMGLISASMMSAPEVLRSPADQWNNVKIPQFSSMVTGRTGENDWVDIDGNNNISWASLSGVMTPGLPTTGTKDFTIETSFMNVSCPDSIRLPILNLEQRLEKLGLSLSFNNASAPWAGSGEWTTLFLDTLSAKKVFSAKPQSLIFGSIIINNDSGGGVSGADDGNIDLYNCTFTTPHVLAQVTCDSSCRVTKARLVDLSETSSLHSPFGYTGFANLLRFIPGSLGTPHPGYSSPTDQFMLGSDSPLSLTKPFRSDGYANIPGSVFARRLTTLVNTVWQASLCPYGIALGPAAGNMSTCSINDDHPHVASASFTNERVLRRSNYATNRWHAIALLAISVLLQLVAFATLIFAALTNVPDILGWVSTITRDNRDLVGQGVVPEGGSWMSGPERSRLLGNLRIRLADVITGQDQEVGRIGFLGIRDGARSTLGERVRGDRLYV